MILIDKQKSEIGQDYILYLVTRLVPFSPRDWAIRRAKQILISIHIKNKQKVSQTASDFRHLTVMLRPKVVKYRFIFFLLFSDKCQ